MERPLRPLLIALLAAAGGAAPALALADLTASPQPLPGASARTAVTSGAASIASGASGKPAPMASQEAAAAPAAHPSAPVPAPSAAPSPVPAPSAAPSPVPAPSAAPSPVPAPSTAPSPAPERPHSRKASPPAKAPAKKKSRKGQKAAPHAAPSPKPSAKPSPKSGASAAPSKTRAVRHAYLPQLLQEVEAKYSEAATLQAEFTQVNEIAALQQKKTSSGVILFKRPDKIRWETQKPDPNLLVSDGRTFWFYTPPFDESEHGQLIERKSNEVQSKLAQALLSGRFSVARDMKITQERATEFILKPRPGTAGTVSEARIEIDPINRYITQVTLKHKGGNRSVVTLSRIQLGKPIGDDAFVFTPPPNTDRVTQ